MMLCSQIQSLKHEGWHYLLPSRGWQACHETTVSEDGGGAGEWEELEESSRAREGLESKMFGCHQ